MISLKKYLDMENAIPDSPEAESSELFVAILKSYRSALQAMGRSGTRACPVVGSDLEQALAKLEPGLSGELTPALVIKTEARVEELLLQWGGRSEEYFKAKAKEVKELLIVLAHTAQSLGDRDQRYNSQFSEFTTRLRAIANLEDLSEIRTSLFQGATELKSYVDRMAEDSKNSVAQLRAEVSTYETRLRAVEELALRDSLTGLANRHNIEERIQGRISNRQTFCISSASVALVERIRKWVFGDYTLQCSTGKPEVKVRVEASIGVVQWRPGESLQQVIERADAAMYQEKKASKKRAAKAGR